MTEPSPSIDDGKSAGKARSYRIRILIGLVTVGVSAVVLGAIVYRQRDILLNYNWDIHAGYLLLSFAVYSVNLFVAAVVWGRIMKALGSDLSVFRHFCFFCISNVSKRLPGTVWYVASRTQLYKTEGVAIRVTSLASGIEFVISLITSIMVSMLFALQIILEYRFSLLGLVGVFVLGVIILHPRVVGWLLRRFSVDVETFRYRQLLSWMAVYVLAWVIAGLVLFAIANTITRVEFTHLGYITGSLGLVNVITSALFFAPSNLGVTEVGLSLLLSRIMPAPIAVIFAVAVRVLVVVYDVLWALVCSLLVSRVKQ